MLFAAPTLAWSLAGASSFAALAEAVYLICSRQRAAHLLRQRDRQLATLLDRIAQMESRSLDTARLLSSVQLTAGLTHDFNHALDIVRRAVAVLDAKASAPPQERRMYHRMIEQAAIDAAALVRRLRDHLAGETSASDSVDLNALVLEALAFTRPLWRVRPEIELFTDLHPLPPIQGVANDLRSVLVNLILNAIEALGPAGRIEIHSVAAAHGVQLWIADSGAGIPQDVQRHLFQPFFTTKPTGMGMGLFGAQKTILDHGGNLTFYSDPERGTRFNIELPAATSNRADRAA